MNNINLNAKIAKIMFSLYSQRSMSIGGGLDGTLTKSGEGRKPQNPEVLRAQEQKVTHDKVGTRLQRITDSLPPLRLRTCPGEDFLPASRSGRDCLGIQNGLRALEVSFSI